VAEVVKSWPVILVSIPVAILLGYAYLYLIRLIGGAIIWISFVLVVLLLAGVGFYCFFWLKT
jgi:hypothetical protein